MSLYDVITRKADGTRKVVSLDIQATPPNTVIENVPCDASVYVGAAVRMSSGTAVNALADAKANANVIGVVEKKPTSTTCNIRFSGVTDSVLSGLDETKEYFLSDITPGLITTTAPIASGTEVVSIGKPYTATQLLVSVIYRATRL